MCTMSFPLIKKKKKILKQCQSLILLAKYFLRAIWEDVSHCHIVYHIPQYKPHITFRYPGCQMDNPNLEEIITNGKIYMKKCHNSSIYNTENLEATSCPRVKHD